MFKYQILTSDCNSGSLIPFIINSCAVPGRRIVLFSEMILPAVENDLSEGADVGGRQKTPLQFKLVVDIWWQGYCFEDQGYFAIHK